MGGEQVSKPDALTRKAKNESAWQVLLATLLLATLLPIKEVNAYPPLSMELYGKAFSFNQNASKGSLIEVLDQSNNVCGSFKTVAEGVYGLVSCNGDDPETPLDEGASPGEVLRFRINNEPAQPWQEVRFQSGAFLEVNISIPVPVCGDAHCDFKFENSFTCPEDCVAGNGTGTGNATTNQTAGGGAQAGGAGGGAGGAGGTGGAGGGGAGGGGALGAFLKGGALQPCREKWVCGNWSECSVEGLRTRNCTDENMCGTTKQKPATVEECVYLPTCFDNVTNGLETDVDCGGNCDPCELGKRCLTHQDCASKYCVNNVCRELSCDNATIYCFDGLKDCGEEGIDCGGPCKPCPVEEKPLRIGLPVCEKDINPLNNQAILFFIAVFLAILWKWHRTHEKVEELELARKNGSLKELDALKKEFSEKRRFWLFTAIITALSIIIYLYYYFFILCETEYKYVWWLLFLVLGFPLLIHYGLKRYEYREEEKIRKLEELTDAHYRQVSKLIELLNAELEDLEKEIAGKIAELRKDPYLKETLKAFPELDTVYKDLVKLYLAYHEQKNPYRVEKELCDNLYALESNPLFKELSEKHPLAGTVYNLLRLLYEQYAKKQELYDELDALEQEASSGGAGEEVGREEENAHNQ